MGHFSDVTVEAEPSGEGSVRLIVTVEERPKIASIDIVGSDKRVQSPTLRRCSEWRRGTPYVASRLEDSRVAILELYERKGFPYAKRHRDHQRRPGQQDRRRVRDRGADARRRQGDPLRGEQGARRLRPQEGDGDEGRPLVADRRVLRPRSSRGDLTLVVARYREDGYIDAVTDRLRDRVRRERRTASRSRSRWRRAGSTRSPG